MNEYRDSEGKFTTPTEQIMERLGTTCVNKHGSSATIIEYITAEDITIQFDNGHIAKTSWSNFHDEKYFKSPLCKSVCGVGYIGVGEYDHTHPSKDFWTQMIHRVYSEKKLTTKPTYKDCEVCKEWLNFQNFAKWFDENYYEIEGERMHLDKDIIKHGNRIYSPANCVFSPNFINGVFIKGKSKRGDYPIGVTLRKDNGKFRVHFTKSMENGVKIKRRRFSYGQYDTPEEGFRIYKTEKEKYIKEVADYYKSQIPDKLYKAMYNYQVEITD